MIVTTVSVTGFVLAPDFRLWTFHLRKHLSVVTEILNKNTFLGKAYGLEFK